MTNETEENTKKLNEEQEKLRDENRRLKEMLQLQKTKWLYSHYLLWLTCLGIVFGAIIGIFFYLVLYAIISIRFLPENMRMVVSIIGLIFYLGFPFFAYIPYVILIKAPNFSHKSWYVYLFSFFCFVSLILYVDPLNLFYSQYQGFERLNEAIIPVVFVHALIMGFCSLFIQQFTERCGYKLVLDGSTFCFRVDAETRTVSKQLQKLDEDFNLLPDKSLSKPNMVYFTGIRNKKKTIFQFFLKPNENETDVALVMHSIINDIPMRIGYDDITKTGKTIVTWLEASGDFTVRETTNESFKEGANQESKKSFHRQPVNLPSKKAVKGFFKAHWKDILIIISLIVALLSWVFPFR